MKEGLNMHYPNNIPGFYPQNRRNPYEENFNDSMEHMDLMGQINQMNIQPTPETTIPKPPSGAGPTPTISETQPPRLVSPIDIEGLNLPPGSPLLPQVYPTPPHFSVPGNPLLPEKYKEILSYENLQYMNGFIRTQIGKECMVTIVIGTSGTLASRLGYLIGVGINYILIQEACSESIVVLDFYSIRIIQFTGKKCPVNLFI
jgi:hypothetical protein